MAQADGPAFRRREDLQKNVEYAKSNLALAQNIQVSRADCALKPQSGRQPTSFRRPGYRDLQGRGPWLCVPALRLVCLFEDDDAAGPLTRNYASAHVGQGST